MANDPRIRGGGPRAGLNAKASGNKESPRDPDYWGRFVNPNAKENAPKGDRTYKPSTEHKGLIGGILNFGQDTSRNLHNFVDTELFGNKRPQGGGYGDYLVGRGRGPAASGGLMRGLPKPAPAEEEGTNTSFMDLMGALMGQFGGSPGGVVENPFISYDPLRQSARDNAESSRLALQSVYSQLDNEFKAAGDSITNRYEDTGETLAANRDETAGRISEAYSSSANQQADIANKLGIQSAVAQAIDEGRDVSSRGADTQARVAEQAQADIGYNSAIGTSEGTYNDRLRQAGSAQGAYNQRNLQSQLMDRLSEIDMAEKDANANRFTAYEGSGPDFNDIFGLAQYINDTGREDQQQGMEYQQQAMRDAMRDPGYILDMLSNVSPKVAGSGLPEDLQGKFFEQLMKSYLG